MSKDTESLSKFEKLAYVPLLNCHILQLAKERFSKLKLSCTMFSITIFNLFILATKLVDSQSFGTYKNIEKYLEILWSDIQSCI